MARLDQDIHFTVSGVPVHMRLDTAAPYDYWILKPENAEDAKGAFAAAMQEKFYSDDDDSGFEILEDYAIITEFDSGIAANIFLSLPEWSGDSFEGLIGADHIINFLYYLKACADIKEFRRGDGRLIITSP